MLGFRLGVRPLLGVGKGIGLYIVPGGAGGPVGTWETGAPRFVGRKGCFLELLLSCGIIYSYSYTSISKSYCW